MVQSLIGVLDVGKTNTKVALVETETGKVVWRSERAVRSMQGPHLRQLDVAQIGSWIVSQLSNAPHKQQISALVPIAHGAAAVLVDGGDRTLLAPDYEDPVFESVADAYRPLRDAFNQTFSPFLPLGLNLGRQLYYLQTHHTDELRRARQILLYPQYWAWLFSGVGASELTSLGCHTDLWRPLEDRYSTLAHQQGWVDLFPPLRPASAAVGVITADLARTTGLDPGCRVLCGIHDSNASYLCHLTNSALADRFAVVSSGTWTIVMAHRGDLRRLREQRDMLANIDALGSPVATARFMGGREYQAIAGPEGMQVSPDPAALGRILKQRAIALPCFSPAGGPFSERPGKLLQADALGPQERATLATLYTALMTDLLLDELAAAGAIVIDGPLATNPLFGPLLSALREDNPVYHSDNRAASALAAHYLVGGKALHSDRIRRTLPLEEPALHAYRTAWREAIDSPGGRIS